jgi:tryptophan-rich sensory protein
VPALHDVFGLLAFVVLCFGAAALGGTMVEPSIPGWYAALRKPRFTPPNWVFGPVWTLLYALMAVAGWGAWRRERSRAAALLFLLQLALNVAWTWLFFGLRRPDLGLVGITLLWLAIVATMIAFWRVSRKACLLLAPYLAWVSFASALNFAIWRMN